MLDGLFMLLTLSTVMAIASFLAGSLPLSFSLSQSRLRLISTVGMGVLVGTALIVIIPEGVETLYSANGAAAHSHEKRDVFAVPARAQFEARASPQTHTRNDPHPLQWLSKRLDIIDDPDPADAVNSLPGPVIPDSAATDSDNEPPRTPTAPGEVSALDISPSEHPPSAEYPSRTPHAWIGLSLILGFILMYLIDTLPHLTPPPRASQNIYSLSDLSSSPTSPSPTAPSRSLSTTLGLCIHAAADGIALGASSSSSTTKGLSFIIFLAIMVHKAPAAFGLTAVLLRQGLGKRAARAHLMVFSLAAPVGAVVTWMLARGLGGGGGVGGGGEEERMRWWTGLLLLFSGGTFLYVAMHTMQEEDGKGNSALEDTGTNGYIDGSHLRQREQASSGRSLKLVLAAVGGMLLPLITQIGHAH